MIDITGTDNLIAIFTGVVAVTTVIYMIITGWLALETRRMRKAQTEPKVSLQLELTDRAGHGGLQLAIRNEGMGSAQDIRFKFSGDPNYFVKSGVRKPITELPIIRDGMSYLAPGRNFTFVLGWLFGDDFRRAEERPWEFNITYKNSSGKQFKDTYTLDFSDFSELIIGGGDPLRKIEGHLDSLNKELRSLGSGAHKLQIITQTKEEQRKELATFLELQAGNPSEITEPMPDKEV